MRSARHGWTCRPPSNDARFANRLNSSGVSAVATNISAIVKVQTESQLPIFAYVMRYASSARASIASNLNFSVNKQRHRSWTTRQYAARFIYSNAATNYMAPEPLYVQTREHRRLTNCIVRWRRKGECREENMAGKGGVLQADAVNYFILFSCLRAKPNPSSAAAPAFIHLNSSASFDQLCLPVASATNGTLLLTASRSGVSDPPLPRRYL